MDTKVKVQVNGEAVLSKVSRMFDNSPKSILLELAQNARRAGASFIDVDFREEEKFVIEHNGAPFEDFGPLFSLGDSGWEKDDTKNEDPAGCGFFIATLFDRVVVESRKEVGKAYRVEATKESLMKTGTNLKIEEVASTLGDANVRMTLYGKHHMSADDFRKVSRHFPVPMTGYCKERYYSGEEHKERKLEDKSIFTYLANMPKKAVMREEVKNGVRFRLIRGRDVCGDDYSELLGYRSTYSYCDYDYLYFNYHGHVVRGPFSKDQNKLLRHIMHATDCVTDTALIITPEGDNGIRMVLPARHNIVENDAYRQMCKDAEDFMVDFLNDQGSHSLEYADYIALGGKDRIKHEADIPAELIRAAMQEDWMVMSHHPDNPGVDFAVERISPNIIFHNNVRSYKGYSWYDKLRVLDNDDLVLFVDDEICQGDREYASENNEAESIVLAAVDKCESDYRQDAEILGELKYGFYTDYNTGIIGNCLPDMCLYMTKDAKGSEAYDDLMNWMDNDWEASDDCEADHPDTQQEMFQEDMKIKLANFFIPDQSDIVGIKELFNRGSYNVPNDVNEITFSKANGTKYVCTKRFSSWYDVEVKEIKDDNSNEEGNTQSA